MGVFFLNWISQLEGPTRNLLLRTLIFTVYLIAGAAIFRLIESKNGIQEKNEFDRMKYELTSNYGINNSILEKFIIEVRRAEADGYWDVDFDRWSFFGSLFFTATVLTTIGFGHMTPRTFGGQLFCMIYAFFGIPITGLMLKSLGEKLMEGSDIVINIFDKKILKLKESRSTKVRTSLLLFSTMILMLLLLAGVAHLYEGWSFFQGLYFGFITLSTIGFGDFVPTTPNYKKGYTHVHVALFILVTFVYITIGLAVVSSVLVSLSRVFENKTELNLFSLRDDDRESTVDSDLEERQVTEKTELLLGH